MVSEIDKVLGGRQGASSRRANRRVAEYGRIWQVTRPSTVTRTVFIHVI